jgi:shikimate dehydrogenase
MHLAAYAALGLDWTYEAIELTEDDLELFLKSLGDDVRGLSVTAPLKRRLVELVEMADDPILRVANTVIVDDGNLSAYNTDVPGVVAALLERGIETVDTARILGGGATASSVAYALSTMGVRHLEIVVRDPSRAADAVDVAESSGLSVAVHTIDEPLLDKVDLLVSTVPGEVIGSRSYELVDASRAVFDVIYDPWPTPLMKAAKDAELPAVSGLDLLAHQAALQVVLMTGGVVSPQLLRDAALGELGAR